MALRQKRQQSSRTPHYGELLELGGLVSEDLEAAFEVGLHEFEFLRRIGGGVLERGGGEALVKATNALECVEAGADKDFAAVARVAEAFDESGFFEAVENAGDGAGGEASVAGKVAGGERALRITGH